MMPPFKELSAESDSHSVTKASMLKNIQCTYVINCEVQ